MSVQYLNIQAYRVTMRLRGMPLGDCFDDPMAEYLPCKGCGAPKGYFCFTEEGAIMVRRITCTGIIGAKDPRTLTAFAKGAEEILAREAEK